MNDEQRHIEEVTVLKEPQFKAGKKVTHNTLGEGIVVGFSSKTGAPFVFFYKEQEKNGKEIICVSYESLMEVE